jgi:outer membrane protein
MINKNMYMKQFLVVCVFLASLSAMSQQKIWTLQESVDHALENNITVLQGKNTLLSNEQDIIAAKGNFLPSLSAGINHTLNIGNQQLFAGQFIDRTANNTNVGINVNQTIFNGFRNLNLKKQASLILESNALDLARIKDDISLNVVNAYLNVLFNKENLETATAQYTFSEKQLEQVEKLVDAGVQPRANIYDSEATLANDSQSVTVAQNNYDLALLTLSQFLQVPFQGFQVEFIDVDSPSEALLYNDVTPVLNYALENRNEIKVAEKNIENSELNTEISRSGFYPTVSAGYGFGSNAFYSNINPSDPNNPTQELKEDPFFTQLNNQKAHNFNINVNIPIFSGYQNKTSVAKSRIQEENSKLNLEQAKLGLEATIQRAFTDAKAAFRTFQAAKKSLVAQELAFNNSQERFNIGAMNAFDLEQARVRLINAQNSLTNAKYDFVFKTKVLDFFIGKPITTN